MGFIAPVRRRMLSDTLMVPESGTKPGERNCSLEMASPLPRALVSAITL